MSEDSGRPTLESVLREAATLSHEERLARIKQCVTEQRHIPKTLPRCTAGKEQASIPYCGQCWSLIDADGLTWSLPVKDTGVAAAR